MEEKYEAIDVYGNSINDARFDDYDQAVEWTYKNWPIWRLVSVKIEYTNDIPSKRINVFIFRKVY